MKAPIRVAALVIAAAASVGLAGTAFAHGKPGVHVKKTTTNKECDKSKVCANASQDLNHNLDGNGDGNTVNVLSGDLNGDKLLSGNNINVPVTIAPNFCGSPIGILSGPQKGVCVGNFHKVNAGQTVGGDDSSSQGSWGQDSPGQGSSDHGSSSGGSPGQDSSSQGSPGQGPAASGAGQPVPDAPAPNPHTGDAAVTG